jgi:hypothetical protein
MHSHFQGALLQAQAASIGSLYGSNHDVCIVCLAIGYSLLMECRDRMPGCVNPPMGGNLDVRHLCPRAPVQGMGAGRWAHGVVVSHPLSMREALGSIPSVSTFGCDASPV